MKTRFLPVALALFLAANLTGCQPAAEPQEGIPVIDLNKKYKKQGFNIQSFFDVEYIPLETTDEFLVEGFIKDVGDRYLVTYNQQEGNGDIFFFDRKTGKAINKINHRGQGVGEYASIEDLILDEAANELFVSNYYMNRVLVYSLPDGAYKRTLTLEEGRQYGEMYNADSQHLIVYDETFRKVAGQKPEKGFYFALLSKQDGSLATPLYIPLTESASPWVRLSEGFSVQGNVPDAIIPNRGDWLLLELSSDTVYNFRPSTGEIEPFMAYIPSTNPERLFSLGVVTDRFYFMVYEDKPVNMADLEDGISDEHPLIYDKQKQICYEGYLFNKDLKEDNMIFPSITHVLNRETLAGYETIPAHRLVRAYEEGNIADGPLKDIASRLDMEDNPVLMLMKYKKP